MRVPEFPLVISAKEIGSLRGPLVSIVLAAKRDYPTACYTLIADSTTTGRSTLVDLKGVAQQTGFCGQAISRPSFEIVLPQIYGIFTLRIRYKSRVDTIKVALDQRVIKIIIKRGVLDYVKTYLRIPSDGIWAMFYYSHGSSDRWQRKREALVQDLVVLGAKRYAPEQGAYAYGKCWGVDINEILAMGCGAYYYDIAYFTYDGNMSVLRDLLGNYDRYDCAPGTDPRRLGDCMTVRIETAKGEGFSTRGLQNTMLLP